MRFVLSYCIANAVVAKAPNVGLSMVVDCLALGRSLVREDDVAVGYRSGS